MEYMETLFPLMIFFDMMENSFFMKESLFKIALDKSSYHILLDFNIIALIIIAVMLIIGFLVFRYFTNKNKSDLITENIEPVEISINTGTGNMKYKIVRNYANIEIAHKLYIELITRKAAIQIDEDNDVIVEIYNSWFVLFKITREELKSFSGDLLERNNKSKELIHLATDILNEGLRPHLTKYQAKFRKWYNEKVEEEKGKNEKDRKSPQEIQKEYFNYLELIDSMKNVNEILIKYKEELEKILGYEKHDPPTKAHT